MCVFVCVCERRECNYLNAAKKPPLQEGMEGGGWKRGGEECVISYAL